MLYPTSKFQKLDEIFGKDHATRDRVIGPKQRRAQWEANDKNSDEIDDEFVFQDQLNNNVSLSLKAAPTQHLNRVKIRRKRKKELLML